jgi:DNA-nicking Smr family endonuclease
MKPTDKLTAEEKALFRAHVKGVRRLPEVSALDKPRPPTKRPFKDNNEAKEVFADALIFPTVQYQEVLEFCRSGLSQPFFRQLKRRQFAIDDTLNLRHRTLAEAREALWGFLHYHCQQGSRCLLIIHGKGHRSPLAHPVLKNYINQWLRQYSAVLAFCSAQPKDGGTGAVYVLLRANKS